MWTLRWLHRRQLSRRGLHGGRLHSWFGDRLIHKSLWKPTRESLARAWLVGFPIAVTPFLPFQAVFACAAALFVRGNLLLCIALQFLSTALTAPVHLPACYFVGEILRGAAPAEVWKRAMETPQDLLTGHAAVSLYLGAFVIGILGGGLGYAIIQKTWRDALPRGKTTPPIRDDMPVP